MHRSEGNTKLSIWQHNEERIAIELICLAFFLSSYVRVFRWLGSLTVGDSYGILFVHLTWLFGYLIYILKFGRSQIAQRTVVAVFTISFVFFSSYFLFPKTNEYFNEEVSSLVTLVIRGGPTFIFLKYLISIDKLVDRLAHYARIGIIVFGLSYFGGLSQYIGYMEWGITIIPSTLFIFADVFRAKYILNRKVKVIDWVFLLVSVFLTVLAGRQWFVILCFALGSCLLLEVKLDAKRIVGLSVFILIGLVFVLNITSILQFINSQMNNLGIENKVINSLLQGTFLDMSNRDHIYEYCFSIINNQGINVSGIFADRFYLSRYASNVPYAHNIFLELLLDFGMLLGGVLIFFLLYILIKKFFVCDKQYRYLYLIFFSLGFIRYLVSSSIFTEIQFLLLVGFVLNTYTNNYTIKYRIKRK